MYTKVSLVLVLAISSPNVDPNINVLWRWTGCVALACFRLPQFSMCNYWTGGNHETGIELMTKQL
jgi:hypothetical protein